MIFQEDLSVRVQWACENGANIVSMSYGSENSSNALQELINSYPEVVFLAAAGNDGSTLQMKKSL